MNELDATLFEFMRPQQVKECRARADVAFLPLGILEWHGLQNPLGLDGLKATRLCCLAARELGGGAVFPSVVWGVPRDSFNTGIAGPIAEQVAKALGTDLKRWQGFAHHGGMDIQEQWLHYQRVLRMALEQIASFGFRSIYVCSGHGPFVHWMRPVCVAFTRASQMADALVTTDWSTGCDAAGLTQDHGGKVETSTMMALDETLVDLKQIDQHPDYRGVGAGADAASATTAFGYDWYAASAKAMVKEARWMVDNYPKASPRHQHGR